MRHIKLHGVILYKPNLNLKSVEMSDKPLLPSLVESGSGSGSGSGSVTVFRLPSNGKWYISGTSMVSSR